MQYFDWTGQYEAYSQMIFANTMEGLTDLEYTKSGKVKLIPRLAVSWESLNNHQLWTFHLKKGVLWSDGVPLKAQHFVDSWKRSVSPEHPGRGFEFLKAIKKAVAIKKGQAHMDQLGVQAIDDHTLRVALIKPTPQFSMLVSSTFTFPIRKKILKAVDAKKKSPVEIPTLGPYVPVRLTDHSEFLVRRNKSYHGEGERIESIHFLNVENPRTASRLVFKSEIDLNVVVPEVLTNKEKQSIQENLPSGYGAIIFNAKKRPFNQTKWRKSFSHQVDIEDLNSVLPSGVQTAKTWLPQSLLSLPLIKNKKNKPETLEKIGSPIKVQFLIPPHPRADRIAERLQFQLKKHNMFELEIVKKPWKLFMDHLYRGDFDLFFAGINPAYPHPYGYIDPMTSWAERNMGGWSDSRYDELVKKSYKAESSKIRDQIFVELNSLVEQEVPLIPLYLLTGGMQKSPQLKGDLILHPSGRHRFGHLRP